MDRRLHGIFLHVLDDQARRALRAYAAMSAPASSGEMFWDAVTLFLAATANISKLLWGKTAATATIRKPLRDELLVGDESPLRSREVRNSFEHIDDRLTEAWRENPDSSFTDLGMGRVEGLTGKAILRHYYPATGDLVFWGDKLNVHQLAAEVKRIFPDAAPFEPPPPPAIMTQEEPVDPATLALFARHLSDEINAVAARHRAEELPLPTVSSPDDRESQWLALTRASDRRRDELRQSFAGRLGWLLDQLDRLGAGDADLRSAAFGFQVNSLAAEHLADQLGRVSHHLLNRRSVDG